MLARMMFRSMLFVTGLLAVGCGEVKEQPGRDAAGLDAPSSPDAAPVDAAAVDGRFDAQPAACDVSKPFGSAIEVPGLRDSAANDLHGTLTADELTIYFASNRGNTATTVMHIYSATRATRDAAFSTPAPVGPLFSTEGESNPSISPDGNTIFFDSLRTDDGMFHLRVFTSTRPNAAVVFPMPSPLDGEPLHTPSITADGKVLYVANLSSGALGRMEKVGAGFGPAQTVDISLGFSVTSPVSSDDLTLFMSLGEQFGDDIHVTTRPSAVAPFPMPVRVDELKTTAAQAAASWVSADGCRLYLTYLASGTDAKSRIFFAVRPR
jgi:WD40 repeat protein